MALRTNLISHSSQDQFHSLPKAAVCMILRPDKTKQGLEVLLVKRKVSESDPWSGHMAFPGGRAKESDGELLNTARREVIEETGIDIGKFELLGSLDDVLPGNKSLCVTPFVTLASESIEVIIDGREITDHVWIPLDFFMDKKNSAPMSAERFGYDRTVTSFSYGESYLVWGMTLRIIDELISRITQSINP